MVAKPELPQPNGSAVPPKPSPSVQAAGKGVGAGIAAWWQSLMVHAEPVKGEAMNAAKRLQTKAKGMKFTMPVDVKVDFLRPTVEAVKESMQGLWVQLPPPAQQAAPFVGVALGSGLIVFAIQQQRLKMQRKRTEIVEMEVQGLMKERASLLREINALQTRPRTDVELRLSQAVAEATNAAAAAAEAAAHAATACIIPRRPPPSAAA